MLSRKRGVPQCPDLAARPSAKQEACPEKRAMTAPVDPNCAITIVSAEREREAARSGPCGGMVDAADSKSVVRKDVGVRVSPGAPSKINRAGITRASSRNGALVNPLCLEVAFPAGVLGAPMSF